jgi:CRP-like cAMP-binding protein
LQFIEELPHKLKLELALKIHSQMYQNINFFKEKDSTFIAWIATLLRPINQDSEEYVYKEGEDVAEIYFIVKGTAGYVLPRLQNRVYKEFNEGTHFGHTELALDKDLISLTKIKHVTSHKNLIRRFTV